VVQKWIIPEGLRIFLNALAISARFPMEEKKMRPFKRDFRAVVLLVCTIGGVAVDGWGQATKFAGTYKYAGGAQEDEARKAAIDHAVESMSSFTRSIARNRIAATTQILGSYTFSFEPGKIIVRPTERPVMISGDKGEPADYVYNGKKSTLTQVLAGNRLTQIFVSSDGKRENEFTLSQEGQVLTVKVTVTSSRLSVPVVYSLSYKKADR
jgi:hypothetical protein